MNPMEPSRSRPNPLRLFLLLPPRLFLLSLLLLLPSCNQSKTEPYTPGLGEIMTLIQMRHAKLWFAGTAKNWPLASYERKELREGFADVLHFHPTHQGSPVSLAEVTPTLIDPPLAQLKKAIASKDSSAFPPAFDALTQACNACHQATAFAYNLVQRRQTNSFSNQDFHLPK
ncbi:MAG TPA: hypothetical protein ENK02_09300 [Planctomycetes bacterium]|nr:hypothetical protein [Planctomycetota bacterium]